MLISGFTDEFSSHGLISKFSYGIVKKVKAKVTLEQTTKAQSESRGIALLFL